MHVVICNERLLPRFGVDRLLLRLGAGLAGRGHRVSFVCLRCERAAVERVPAALHVTPELLGLGLHAAEAAAQAWLRAHWAALAGSVLVSGGWPFFGASAVCRERGVPSVFIDAGAVPHDGMGAEEARIQQELRQIRARTLPAFDRVLPISDFIRDTQTLPDRGTAAGVEVVRLGADHLDDAAARPDPADAAALARVDALLAAGGKPMLALGRFEPGNYKNGRSAFAVLAAVLAQEPDARLLLLARDGELDAPEGVRDAVVALGFVGDAALDAVMGKCALGLSLSLWEGFNLPLAEMQWRGRPVLAFCAGAHPEVTADPWLLCGGVAEMAGKAVRLLRGEHDLGGAFERFRQGFRWEDAVGRYAGIIEAITTTPTAPTPGRVVVVDVSSAARDPANPGVMRVVRRTCATLQREGGAGLLLMFVRWDQALRRYRWLDEAGRRLLAGYDGPQDGFGLLLDPETTVEGALESLPRGAAPVLFIPEVVLDGQFPERLLWAGAQGMRVAAILYDLIPVTHIPLCASDVAEAFPRYLQALSCVDALWAISGESLRQFERYAGRHRLPLPAARAAVWLPGQFAAEPRAASVPATDGPLVVLCVGSIEPRKNHRALIEAFRALLARRPDLDLRLVLAGHRFGGADELADWLEGVTRGEARIDWTGLLPDAELAALYRRAAFTVYPSLVEGFGLPVMESLWMGRPCLCHSGGVKIGRAHV